MPFECAFTIRSDTRYLTCVREFLHAAAALVGRRRFPKRAVTVCTLALIEAIDNAIFHAHRGRRGRPIGIALAIDDNAVTMEVVDTGAGIDGIAAAEPDLLEDHGRGLFLIRQTMTDVESVRRRGRHALRMTYRL